MLVKISRSGTDFYCPEKEAAKPGHHLSRIEAIGFMMGIVRIASI
jgi:hypothetical protein